MWFSERTRIAKKYNNNNNNNNYYYYYCYHYYYYYNSNNNDNMPSIERSFYLINTRTSCAIFLHNWTHCIDGFNLLLQGYVKKGNDATNPAILSFFFVTRRTMLNAAHPVRVKSKISIEWKNYAYFSRTTHWN